MIGILYFLFIVVCILLILIILLQVGRGHGAFGVATAESLFGPRRGNILTRITGILGACFMIFGLLLALLLPTQIKKTHMKLPPISPPPTEEVKKIPKEEKK